MSLKWTDDTERLLTGRRFHYADTRPRYRRQASCQACGLTLAHELPRKHWDSLCCACERRIFEAAERYAEPIGEGLTQIYDEILCPACGSDDNDERGCLSCGLGR